MAAIINEPWVTSPGGVIKDATGRIVPIIIGRNDTPSIREYIAEHIVECVNACAGKSKGTLLAMAGHNITTQAIEKRELQQARLALVASLRRAMHYKLTMNAARPALLALSGNSNAEEDVLSLPDCIKRDDT